MINRICAVIVTGVLLSGQVISRENVSIAGSSTVLPFATIVAERLGRNPNVKTPIVESGGSSVGKKGVCDGVGTEFIDIGNASSRMKPKELEYCNTNGVQLTEIMIGYDGIVVANARQGPVLNITLANLGKALTARVPINGQMVDNPYQNWSDINPSLPNIAIRVYGPPTTSGTRASFAEIVNEKAFCGKDPEVRAIGFKAKQCRAMRTDGAYIEAGEQDNLIVQKLQDDQNAFGILGFSYLDQNSDSIKGATLSGVEPTFEEIAEGRYKASRALYFYVKHQHVGVIPGIEQYMTEWTKHWGDDGILADAGMIPMAQSQRDEMKHRMSKLVLLRQNDL